MRPSFLALLAILATATLAFTQTGQPKCSSGRVATQVISTNATVFTPATVVQPILVPAFAFQFLPALTPSIVASAAAAPQSPAFTAGQDWPVAVAFLGSASGNRGPEAALDILRNKCAACHTFPGGKSSVNILDRAGNVWGEAPRQRIAQAVADGHMPPKGPLSLNEISVIQRWASNQ